ncbi:MAG: aminopeptidase P family protein [Deferribacteraceae bacterium]|jgi:Xaa-Pro aminopeptidase|nr:aminopeptidase P family protein [Deferribacteraceae bacterium]
MDRYLRNIMNLKRLLTALSDIDYGRYLITSLSDIAWLTGFTGSAALVLLGGQKPLFISDGRYALLLQTLLGSEWEIEIVKSYSDYLTAIAQNFKKITIQKQCTYQNYTILAASGAEICTECEILSALRAVKTDHEIEAIKREYSIAAEAFNIALKNFQSGKSELYWAAELEYEMKALGRAPSFSTIIASGPRGALPHGEPSEKIISDNDAIVVDFGTKKLYTSDYTRLLSNSSNVEASDIAKIVEESVHAAKERVKPGASAKEVDFAARNVIERYGYGEFFNHATGHGVGVDVHEQPTIRADSADTLLENMVFTIEPGIYLPQKLGVRLEDTVRVSADGYEDLSRLDRYIYPFN